MFLPFIKGVLLGFSIAAPVGPIGLLCIRKTLSDGKRAGFISGLGAATADAVYGAIAAFGLTAISGFLLSYQHPIQYIGSVFLFYLAIKIFLSKPTAADSPAESPSSKSLLKTYSSTFLLTITNPVTILSFIALFAGLGVVAESATWISSTLIVLGVFLGSALWWFVLSLVFGMIKHKVSNNWLVWINRGSGVLIAVLGIIGLMRF